MGGQTIMQVSFLMTDFKNQCLFTSIANNTIPDAPGILLLDKSIPIEKNYIYIATKDAAAEYFSGITSPGLTLFIVTDEWDHELRIPPDHNVAVIDSDIPHVFNSLFFEMRRWHILKRELLKIPAEQNNTQRFLDTAVRYMDLDGVTMYILSPAFQILYSASHNTSGQHELTESMIRGEYLSTTQIDQCLKSIVSVADKKQTGEGGSRFRTFAVQETGLLGYLLVFGPAADSRYEDLIQMIIKLLPDFLIPVDEDELKDYQLLSQIMDDVFLSPNMDIDKLQKSLMKTPDPVDKYIRNVLIEFDSDKVSVKNFVKEMKILFGTNNITMYDGRIVAWLSGSNHIFKPEFDESEFDDLLKRYHCKAVISNAGRFLRGIRTLYIQSKDILSIMDSLDFVLKGRSWAYYDELSFYHMIQLCESAIFQSYGHNRLVYLAGPGIMEVIRYDQDHNTNFLEFLFAYIENGRNIGKTAEELHMHRNTVVYKLKKVEELLHTNSLNTKVFHELETSCRVMMYAKYVARETYNIALNIKEARES